LAQAVGNIKYPQFKLIKQSSKSQMILNYRKRTGRKCLECW